VTTVARPTTTSAAPTPGGRADVANAGLKYARNVSRRRGVPRIAMTP